MKTKPFLIIRMINTIVSAAALLALGAALEGKRGQATLSLCQNALFRSVILTKAQLR